MIRLRLIERIQIVARERARIVQVTRSRHAQAPTLEGGAWTSGAFKRWGAIDLLKLTAAGRPRMDSESLRNGSDEHQYSPESWRAAAERLDHLRSRKAGSTSTFVKRQYDRALADFIKACSARERVRERSGLLVPTAY